MVEWRRWIFLQKQKRRSAGWAFGCLYKNAHEEKDKNVIPLVGVLRNPHHKPLRKKRKKSAFIQENIMQVTGRNSFISKNLSSQKYIWIHSRKKALLQTRRNFIFFSESVIEKKGKNWRIAGANLLRDWKKGKFEWRYTEIKGGNRMCGWREVAMNHDWREYMCIHKDVRKRGKEKKGRIKEGRVADACRFSNLVSACLLPFNIFPRSKLPSYHLFTLWKLLLRLLVVHKFITIGPIYWNIISNFDHTKNFWRDTHTFNIRPSMLL